MNTRIKTSYPFLRILTPFLFAIGAMAACAEQSGPVPGPNPDGGSGSGGGPVHGSICASSSDCNSARTGLTCVFDELGDVQGICMQVCESFQQCLGNSEALGRGETDCCQIFGGTSVCGDEDNFPADACH